MRFNFAGVFCKTLGFSIQQIVLFSLALSAEVLCGLHLFIEWTFDWVDVHSLFSLLLDKWCVNLLKDCTTGWRSPPPTECSQQVKRSFKTGGTSLLFHYSVYLLHFWYHSHPSYSSLLSFHESKKVPFRTSRYFSKERGMKRMEFKDRVASDCKMVRWHQGVAHVFSSYP